MNAQVPYLAGLAHPAGPAGARLALRPPRRPVGEGSGAPTGPDGPVGPRSRPAGSPEGREDQVTPEAPVTDGPVFRPAAGRGAGARVTGAALPPGDSGAGRGPAGSIGPGLAGAGAAGIDVAGAGAGGHGPAGTGTSPVARGGADPGDHPAAAAPSTDSRAPRSWTDPIWDRPVALPAGPGTGGRGEGLAREEAAPGLRPPAARQTQSGPGPGDDPGDGPLRVPASRGRARVSIGTIEVTVVPPPASPPARPVRPAAPPARARARPPSLIAAGPGAERLRDGLRRWHGTAQG